jgi:hypothetical protein
MSSSTVYTFGRIWGYIISKITSGDADSKLTTPLKASR